MSLDQTLANLKRDVRALLLSSQLGLSAEQLRKDYVGMLGRGMPLRELGFCSVLDMAKEMPDVVSLSYLADGRCVLKAVSSESTHAIKQMVSRQRPTKTKRQPLRSPPAPRPHAAAPVILPRWRRPPPALPAPLRAQLRQLLSQGPLRLSDMESRFQQCFGRPLRFTDYGFYSLWDMLARVPDLSIQYTRMGSLVSLERPDRPSPQSGPQLPRTGPVKPGATRPSQTPVLSPVTGLLQPAASSAPSQCSPSPSITQNSSVPSCKSWDPRSTGSQWVPDNGPPPRPPDPEPQKPNHDGQLLGRFMHRLEAQLCQKILENSDAGSVSPELKARLQKVVGEHSQGLSIHDLPAHYKRVFGEELPVLQSGFLSVTELVAALSDVFHLEPAGGTLDPGWTVRNISGTTHTGSECGGEEGRQSGGRLYQQIRRSLWEKPEEEEEEEEEEVEVEEEDQPDPTTCLPSSFTTQQPVALYPAVQVRFGSAVPLDAVRGQRLRPPTRRPRALAAVLVEQVESPGSFHVRFSESQESRSLEDMMMEMRGCYTCPQVARRYRLPERYLRPGQVCCVAPQDLWFYRVVVQRLVSPVQVEVYYVDFGDRSLVSTDRLMFLKSCYSQLPVQAVPAMLTGVEPTSGAWSAAATASFRALSRDRALVAVLQGYHGDALQLSLCDTHTEDDRYVHAALLQQGHARPRPPRSPTDPVEDCLKSLYLGLVLIDREEEEEEENTTTPTTAQPITGQHCQSSVPEEALPDLPGLELVEAAHNPSESLSSCESWLERKPSGEGDQTPASGGAVEDPRPPGPPGLPEPAADHPPTDLPSCGSVSPAAPLHCTDHHGNTWTRPEEESGPGVEPGPVVTPDPCGALVTFPSAPPSPILSTLSLLTPGLAKSCFYGVPGGALRPPGPTTRFPLFGGRGLAAINRKCD